MYRCVLAVVTPNLQLRTVDKESQLKALLQEISQLKERRSVLREDSSLSNSFSTKLSSIKEKIQSQQLLIHRMEGILSLLFCPGYV